MKTLTIEILKGLPASGKTTYALEKIKDTSWQRVNKDTIRFDLAKAKNRPGAFVTINESEVIAERDRQIRNYLFQGFNVVVDDTNLNPIHIPKIKEIARLMSQALEIEIKVVVNDSFLEVPLEDCIQRNNKRPELERIPTGAITKMYQQWLKTKKAQGTRFIVPPEPDPSKRSCIICDLDGTLALNTSGRSYYDASTCEDDEVNYPVLQVLYMFSKSALPYDIIFVSGREAKYEHPTRLFLKNKCGFEDSEYLLYMRESGDNRKDSIVKEEIYQQKIEPHYNVFLVLDDRDQVVNMWRSHGLPTWQVNPGNF